MRLKEAFDKEEISIPFPIRTLDFGVKGGKELTEMIIESENHGKETREKGESDA